MVPSQGTTTGAEGTQVSCPLRSANYLLGATFVHVVHQLSEGTLEGRENGAGVMVRLQRGGNATQEGEALASEATDARGCATFLLDRVGRYRFQTDWSCGSHPAVAMDWNGTFMDQVEMTVSDCE
jgi:hypothetical protein